MQHRYKPLNEQTIVITGATSGIGLATARRAAPNGANVVLVARNEKVLKQISEEINAQENGRAAYAVADVGIESEVQGIVDVAVAEFGGFDTWFNNAGVVVFSELKQLPTKDHHRLFQTNYYGVVYGSLAALEHLRHRPDGGTVINMASINADMPVPILGAYSASKAAVQAYSDVLRMELLDQDIPVKVSVIKPSGIATPISEHGLSHNEDRGKVMPPLYDPEIVARTVLEAAQKPVRNITVGETGKATAIARTIAPDLGDRFIGWLLPKVQSTGKPKMPSNNLYSAGEDGQVYIGGERHGLPVSPYTRVRLNPAMMLGGVVAVAFALAVLMPSRAAIGERRLKNC